MMRTGTYEAAQANRRHLTLANGTGYWRSDFIRGGDGDEGAPQAFLVEQDPNTVILPHFHERDQFQVVVDGGGMLGRHAVGAVSVHYAGRHTGYGPITADARGLSYFSLRATTDPGARFLPESRARMEGGPKLNLLADPVAEDGAPLEEVLAPRPDGIAAWMLRVAPGETAAMPAHPGGGRYLLVVAGELRLAGARLPRFGTVFVPAGERPALAAGAQGLKLLVLQFPRAGAA